MLPSKYEITDKYEEESLFIIKNVKNGNIYNYRYSLATGPTCDCKAISIWGKEYLCRHKKIILRKFIKKEFWSDFFIDKI